MNPHSNSSPQGLLFLKLEIRSRGKLQKPHNVPMSARSSFERGCGLLSSWFCPPCLRQEDTQNILGCSRSQNQIPNALIDAIWVAGEISIWIVRAQFLQALGWKISMDDVKECFCVFFYCAIFLQSKKIARQGQGSIVWTAKLHVSTLQCIYWMICRIQELWPIFPQNSWTSKLYTATLQGVLFSWAFTKTVANLGARNLFSAQTVYIATSPRQALSLCLTWWNFWKITLQGKKTLHEQTKS